MSKTEFIVEPGKQEVVMKRTFDAPASKLFDAYTDPEAIKQWWGPSEYETIIDEFNPIAGGKWRIIHKDTEGNEYGFHGVYHSVEPTQIVHTFEYEGEPGHVLMETSRFEEENGKTHLTNISVFQTVEDRDGMVAYGMESGATEGMELLAKIVEG